MDSPRSDPSGILNIGREIFTGSAACEKIPEFYVLKTFSEALMQPTSVIITRRNLAISGLSPL